MLYRVCNLGEVRFWQCTCIIVVRDWESKLPLTHHMKFHMSPCAGLCRCTVWCMLLLMCHRTPQTEAHVELHRWTKNSAGHKLVSLTRPSSHCYKLIQTPTERLVLNPMKRYELHSNGKVNHPRRKINLENCLNSCRPVSLSLRDHTEGRGWDECLLVLRGQVHSLYSRPQRAYSFCLCSNNLYWSFSLPREKQWAKRECE